MPFIGIFGTQFWTTIVVFEISTIQFVKMETFVQIKKASNLRRKCLIWVILGSDFKKLLSIWICQNLPKLNFKTMNFGYAICYSYDRIKNLWKLNSAFSLIQLVHLLNLAFRMFYILFCAASTSYYYFVLQSISLNWLTVSEKVLHLFTTNKLSTASWK